MPELWIAAIVFSVCLFLWLRHKLKIKQEEAERKQLEESRLRAEEAYRRRRESLIAKFGSEEIADAIIGRKIWQEMTSECLLESWGRPVDVDKKVFKQKTSETWKYDEIGKNRYSRRVFLENGAVVGWEQK